MPATERRARKATSRRAYRDERYGEGYDAFRTGLTFRTARRMLHGQPARNNPRRWRDKTRSAVLGFMHEIKLQLWFQIQDANEGG